MISHKQRWCPCGALLPSSMRRLCDACKDRKEHEHDHIFKPVYNHHYYMTVTLPKRGGLKYKKA